MSKPLVDFEMKVGLKFEEAADGLSIVLFTTDPGPATFDAYRVAIKHLPDGRWYAQIPLMPQYNVVAATQEDAKKALEATVMAYLRERHAFIHNAAPLLEQYIVPVSHPRNGASHADDGIPSIKGYDQSVSSIMRAMGNAFAMSSIGDDSRIISPELISETAKRLDLPEDVVRAAVAYYLDHKEPIRKKIYRDIYERLDRVFTRIQEESGLSEEEFAKLFARRD